MLVPVNLPLPRPGNSATFPWTPITWPPVYRQYSILLRVVLIFNEYYKTLAQCTERRTINPLCKMGTGICWGSTEALPWESCDISQSVALNPLSLSAEFLKAPIWMPMWKAKKWWKGSWRAKLIFLSIAEPPPVGVEPHWVIFSARLFSFQMRNSLRARSSPWSPDFGSEALFDETPCFWGPCLAPWQG